MASDEVNLVWLQAGGCSGCSVSFLNSARPSARNLLIDQLLPGVHLSLKYHPTVMAGQGQQACQVLEELPQGEFVLALEGSLPRNEDFCMVGTPDGGEVSILRKFADLAEDAALVLAVGTCASFGGIPAGAPNPGDYASAADVLAAEGIATPVVNVPGCPPHPDWVSATVLEFLARGEPGKVEVDALGRPLIIYGQLIHENCPRRPYFDEGKFAEKPGDPECLHEVGCKGPITYADCPLREWNDGRNWCVKAGGPCQGCTQPEFIDQTTPIYQALEEDQLPKIGEDAAVGAENE
ncbi:MAG: hydrogenase small subunit [Candidatus Brocadiia bacterium]